MNKKEYLQLKMSITLLTADTIRTSGDPLGGLDVWNNDQIWGVY